MTRYLVVLLMLIATGVQAKTEYEVMLSPEGLRIETTLSIARWYELNRDQAILLLAIYDHELAPREQMKTCSYFGIRRATHPGLSYCKSDKQEFQLSAGICAMLIKRHCPDLSEKSLKQFNHGYTTAKGSYKGYATDEVWWVKVRHRSTKYKNIFY